ncbi:MAG: helicase associated domain-containing protein, partial [Chloroflexota bacterium]
EAVLGWTWDPSADRWRAGLAQLRAYIEREGHAQVPRKYTADDGFGLGSWVSHQLRAKRLPRPANGMG